MNQKFANLRAESLSLSTDNYLTKDQSSPFLIFFTHPPLKMT